MKLNNIISESILECLNNQQILREYVSNELVYLKDYFSMSYESKLKDLPYEFYYFFNDFLDETETSFEVPMELRHSNNLEEPYEEVEIFDNDLELITWLENNNVELFNKFAKYLYDKIESFELPIHDADYPAWSYFDDNPKIVKNQWLIHFTNDAYGIARDGFKYGVDDMTKLGLTTSLGEFDKKYGGYNFAYLLLDFPKYGTNNYSRGGGYKYGKEAVIFNASGIKIWHLGDNEPQVIFYGNTARNIIPITSGENAKFAIYGRRNNILFEDDNLVTVVNWVVNNFQQYRKAIY